MTSFATMCRTRLLRPPELLLLRPDGWGPLGPGHSTEGRREEDGEGGGEEDEVGDREEDDGEDEE